MSSDERQRAHALAVQARGGAMPAEGMPSGEILDSWVRCMNTGLDSRGSAPIAVVDGADLARRRERAEATRRLARAELETLAQQIAGSNYLLAFADADGVILDLFCDNRFSTCGSGSDILAGSCWSEALCGTNGLGTALSTGHSVAVTGLEHYFVHLGDLSCTATPVRDAQGAIVGVLDASSYFESRQRHTQALVRMAATNMENGLFVHQMRSRVVLAVHPRPEFLGTLSAGLLAFDGEGRLLALNAGGRQLLQGPTGSPGNSFEDLFGEPFEPALARMQRGGELRLRDAFGGALVATCISRPAEHRAPGKAVARHARGAGLAESPALVVADDPAVAEAFRLAEAAARIGAPILIQGETGTGKEVLARHAHQHSGRAGLFVAVNCAALPDDLFEAELFGYAGGAFTGARREGSAGLIASADGGTLLLDEVRELPLHLQAALLRFLDDQLVRPVGGTQTRRVDVQVLAATNSSLDDEVAARRFRADLLYRLNTVCVALPPLRRRRDFAAAVRGMLGALDAQASIAADAIERLSAHDWPGNFRELRAVLTRALLSCGDGRLSCDDIDRQLPRAPAGPARSLLRQEVDDTVRREFERTGHNISETSRNLGVSRTTVYRHLRAPRN
ncbi:MAG TPA: sigma-54-dependent Fis family transcriptional regulator [Ideonella sp.]|nr:sigma-54-dependent Fis family transcriptional regulator [Ideonella sp.]